MKRKVSLVLAGIDGSGKELGASLGPRLLRMRGIEQHLAEYVKVARFAELGPSTLRTGGSSESFPFSNAELEQSIRWLGNTMHSAFVKSEIPVCLIGDHTFSGITVGEAMKFHGELTTIWVDAHSDAHIPDTSQSKNLHGMVVSALAQLPYKDHSNHLYEMLRRYSGSAPPAEFCFLGLRSVDRAEQDHLGRISRYTATMEDVDRKRFAVTVEEMLAKMPRGRKIWVSFDIDSLDDSIGAASGTPVPYGLSYRNLFLLAEMLFQSWASKDIEIVGVEIAELNPTVADTRELTSFLLRWIQTMFGRSIRGERSIEMS